MTHEIIDPETLLLSLIGAIPIIGEATKDQISAYINRVEMDRIHDTISRLRTVLSTRITRKIDKSEIPSIIRSIMVLIEKSKHEEITKKRNIMASIVANAIALQHDQSRVQWFINKINQLSIQSIEVLHSLSLINSTEGHQFHSHSGVLGEIERKIGYSFQLALLKELSLSGLIDLKIDHSSMINKNPRFIVFWRDVSNDFIAFLKDE